MLVDFDIATLQYKSLSGTLQKREYGSADEAVIASQIVLRLNVYE